MDAVISADGTAIAYDRTGDGPALVLVGGALTTRAAFPPVSSLLASRFSVFAYDRRGRGDSGDTPPYAVEREIEDLRALIDAGGGEAFVFGHSSGAALAMEAAGLGAGIRRLAVYEPPFILDAGRPSLPDDFAARLAARSAAGPPGDVLAYYFEHGLQVPPAAIAGMRADPSWAQWEAIAHTLAYDAAVLGARVTGRPLPAEPFASIAAPTLVLTGGASPAWMQAAGRTVAAAIPGGRHRTLEGQGHGAAPDVLAPVLVEFFGSGQ
ncbi:MAG TPA: alpha/beta hydrolase [Candidatus Dormibacteraeota bacterium]|jgi:pimeloyl-ACP methyl ester carboxylesterase